MELDKTIKYSKALIVFIGLLTLFTYLPFRSIDRNYYDGDTIAILSKWKGSPFAWGPSDIHSRRYHTISAQIIRQLLSFVGKNISREESFVLLTVLSMSGIVLFVGLLIHECTKNTVLSLSGMMLVAFVPGNLKLLSWMEDNVFSSFVHVLYVYCIIKWAHLNSNYKSSISISIFNYLLLPAIFFLTIFVHPQNIPSIVTPLFLFLFIKRIPNLKIKICQLYACFIIIVGIIFVNLTIRWTGNFSVSDWLYYIKDYFHPHDNPFVVYYFWNYIGWDIVEQSKNVIIGISSMFSLKQFVSGRLSNGFYYSILAYVFPVICTVIFAVVQSIKKRKYTLILLVLCLLVHVPHPLVFNSYFIERWDTLIPPSVAIYLVSLHITLNYDYKSQYFKPMLIAFFSIHITWGILCGFSTYSFLVTHAIPLFGS
jgi:hypothetical protein